MKVEDKHIRTQSETSQNQEGYTMQQFPAILGEAIERWCARMKKLTKNKFFCPYTELSKLVDIAPSTLRSYTNEFDLTTPPVHKLIIICKTISDNTPLEFIHEYQKALFK